MAFIILPPDIRILNIHWGDDSDILVFQATTGTGFDGTGSTRAVAACTISDFKIGPDNLIPIPGMESPGSWDLTPAIAANYTPAFLNTIPLTGDPFWTFGGSPPRIGDELPFDDILVGDGSPITLGLFVDPITSEMLSHLLMWTPVRPMTSGNLQDNGESIFNAGHWCIDITGPTTFEMDTFPATEDYNYYTVTAGVRSPNGSTTRIVRIHDTGILATRTITWSCFATDPTHFGTLGAFLSPYETDETGGTPQLRGAGTNNYLFMNLKKIKAKCDEALSGQEAPSFSFKVTLPFSFDSDIGIRIVGGSFHATPFVDLKNFPFDGRNSIEGAELFQGYIIPAEGLPSPPNGLGWDMTKTPNWDAGTAIAPSSDDDQTTFTPTDPSGHTTFIVTVNLIEVSGSDPKKFNYEVTDDGGIP